ncbi:hypothetical protein CDL15_Pgr005591 [Punica granatum]|uniref:Uncharacterized protein n=1 Tax=Punica granatum TaxID=22663 RepID=A0A218WEY4_PUNGR|nr:hypothetical protein CDL15_Pgr005591 [Punica granatum]
MRLVSDSPPYNLLRSLKLGLAQSPHMAAAGYPAPIVPWLALSSSTRRFVEQLSSAPAPVESPGQNGHLRKEAGKPTGGSSGGSPFMEDEGSNAEARKSLEQFLDLIKDLIRPGD